jgi:hypothetical protein
MRRLLSGVLPVALAASLSLACGRSSGKAASSDTLSKTQQAVVSAQTEAETSAASGDKKPKCAPTGLWALCSVEKRLTQSGFVVIKSDSPPPKRAGFSVAPTVYTLGHSRLEVFLYPSAAAVAREVAALDTLRIAPRGGGNNWEGSPIFVRAGNLLAVFMTDNPQSAERVSLALTAGAPQPAAVPQLKPMVTTPSSSR